jgi:hypothetical protein
MEAIEFNEARLNQIKAVFRQLEHEICYEENGADLLQSFKSAPLKVLQERGLDLGDLSEEIRSGLARSLASEQKGVSEPVTGQTGAANEFWSCWFCTKGMELAITIPISLGGAALFVGGEAAIAAIGLAAPGIALILGISLTGATQVLTQLVNKVSNIPELVNELAIMACKGMAVCP